MDHTRSMPVAICFAIFAIMFSPIVGHAAPLDIRPHFKNVRPDFSAKRHVTTNRKTHEVIGLFCDSLEQARTYAAQAKNGNDREALVITNNLAGKAVCGTRWLRVRTDDIKSEPSLQGGKGTGVFHLYRVHAVALHTFLLGWKTYGITEFQYAVDFDKMDQI